jgi:hypothetical protein
MARQAFELALVSAVASTPLPQQRAERFVSAVGPGWFDSSWDLHAGLEVSEGWPADMRLHGWLEDFLQAQRTADCTASPSASTAIA